jgi:hypothetical protein
MAIDSGEALDMNAELMLDGNAIAGTLYEIFGADVSAASCECVACGNDAALATFHAFTHGPGAVLRCSACGAVGMRVVERADAYVLDARGLAWLRIERRRPATHPVVGSPPL